MKLSFVLAGLPLLAEEIAGDLTARKERALGAGLAAEVQRDGRALGNSAVSQYVEGIGARLTDALTSHNRNYRFEVIAGSADDEPFGLPGGFVFVPAKFFLNAEDEPEFAAMLAHAVAHVEQRHGFRAVNNRATQETATVPILYIGGHTGSHDSLRNGTRLLPLGAREFARQNELSADEFSVPLLHRAGFDAHALRRYVARNQTGPHLEDRLARLDATLAGVAARPAVESPYAGIRTIVSQAVSRQVKPPSLRR